MRDHGVRLQKMGDLAMRQYRAGRLKDAANTYRKMLKIAPNDADVLHVLGLLLVRLHRHEEAERCFRRAVRVRPAQANYHYCLGTVLDKLGRQEEATSCYHRALALLERRAPGPESESAAIHALRGNVMRALRRLDAAIVSYQQALARKPTDSAVLNNLGATWKDLGRVEDAIDCYRRSIAINANNATAHVNLGVALRDLGRYEEALDAFTHGLELDPNNPTARHYHAALTGQTTETAPTEVVRHLFDTYAAKFDEHLTHDLCYDVPTALRRLLDSLRPETGRFANALDIGCGTGLSGAAFRDVADQLIGVDLSPQMVEQARRKQLYDALHLMEIAEFLQATQTRYDLVISTDVFIYVGALDRVFPAVRARMTDAGIFLFSTERAEGDAYVLRESGRYAHSRPYIESLAEANGFDIVASEATHIRKEHGSFIPGDLFALRCRED